MKQITQTKIAEKLNISVQFVNAIVQNKKRPSWNRAKQLAEFTKTKPELWLEGSSEQIKAALAKNNINPKNKKRG